MHRLGREALERSRLLANTPPPARGGHLYCACTSNRAVRYVIDTWCVMRRGRAGAGRSGVRPRPRSVSASCRIATFHRPVPQCSRGVALWPRSLRSLGVKRAHGRPCSALQFPLHSRSPHSALSPWTSMNWSQRALSHRVSWCFPCKSSSPSFEADGHA